MFCQNNGFRVYGPKVLRDLSFLQTLILEKMQDGIMQTHDEETRRFFKHSSVQVLLCPRTAGKKHSWVKQRVR